jgi:hypothetical protein
MKVALCFIISYNHVLNKEAVWRKWIEANKELFNIYVYYKDITKIQSAWLKQYAIPEKYIYNTSYYHVMPAYISLMNFALLHDTQNQWFCFLTDSCCPIVSPKRFKYSFNKYYNKSIISWKPAWWNITFHKRANLELLPEKARLGNDPYFILKRENVKQCLHFIQTELKITRLICDGGLANESLFAIILYNYKELSNALCFPTHVADWSRMASATSPHLFCEASKENAAFIEESLIKHPYMFFIRKMSPDFPDAELNKYIYEYSLERDSQLIDVNWFLIKIMYYVLFGCLFIMFFTYYSFVLAFPSRPTI